jgi:hypothetical protein
LEAYSPNIINTTLGFVSAVLDSSIEIEGESYSRAGLADIFLEIVGGSDEAI